MTVRLRIYAAALLVVLLAMGGHHAPAFAHSMDIASARVELDGAHAVVRVMFDGTRITSLDENKDGIVAQGELDAGIETMFAKLKGAITFTGPDAPTQMKLTRYEVVGEQHIILLTLDLEFAAPVQDFAVAARMSTLLDDPAPLVVTLSGPGVKAEALISADGDVANFKTTRPMLDVFTSFIKLGVEHIFTGYDHLAFLMCLLLGATSRRSLIWTVTAFTLAHSITLSAATLDFIRLPGPLVETAIAATIIYVAIENLTGSRLVQRPWITGAFGLIHGFGFAGVLQDIGIPAGQTILSLFAFNLGVEVGQLIFIGIAYVLLGAFVTSRRLRAAVSVAAVCVALFWFIERVAMVI
jgi:hydrogenase/urease accessory protein HupE